MIRNLFLLGAFGWLAAGCGQAPHPPPETSTAVAEPAAESEWLTDFARARQAAAEKNTPILVNFSGSDWCGWCIRLDEEVFSQAAFRKYAADNLVLFVADFPRRASLPDNLREQNEQLAREHGIQGFPTVLLLDAEGKAVARTGYRPGGAESYVQHLRSLLEGNT